MPGAGFSFGGGPIEITISGLDDALAKVTAAAGRLEHPAPMFDLIGAALVASTQHRFETEIDPTGARWPISVRAQLTGGKTMTDSGQLRSSITHEASDQGVEVGTNLIKAATLQFGATIVPVAAGALHFTIGGRDVFTQKVRIPPRPFLGIDEDDEHEIMEIAEEYVLAPFSGGVNAAQ